MFLVDVPVGAVNRRYTAFARPFTTKSCCKRMDNLYEFCLCTWVLPVGLLSQGNGTAKGGKGEELPEQGRQQEDNNRAIHFDF